MSAIVLNEEQMDVLRQVVGPIQVCDREGAVLGTIDPDRSEELHRELQLLSPSDKRSYPSEEVSALLQFLEKTSRKEGRIDKARLKQLVHEFHENYEAT